MSHHQLNCIMLVDDDDDDNFIHERAIKKNSEQNTVIAKNSGQEALDYLNSKVSPHTDLIFLDINMPSMNGWEFLQEYGELPKSLQSQAIIIMLTTSGNSDDIIRAKSWDFVYDFITKPLTKEMMASIKAKYFEENGGGAI